VGVVSARPRALNLLRSREPPRAVNRDDDGIMADVAYTAADKHSRDARRTGLQAKKDEQPANIARSYRSK
jgi:hypothetical protein